MGQNQTGKKGFSVDVGYDHKFTFKPDMPQMVNAHTYARALNQARANDRLSPTYNPYELEAFKTQSAPFIYPDVDWAKETLNDLGAEDRVYLGINGGSDPSTTQLQINAQGSFIETTRPDAITPDGLFHTLYTLPASAFPVRTEDGIWGGDAVYGSINPVAKIQGSGYLKNHNRSLYADAKLVQDFSFWLDGLSASVRVGYDNYSSISEQKKKGFEYASDRYVYDAEGNVTETVRYKAGDKTSNLKWAKWQNRQWRRTNFVFTVDYKKKIEAHNLIASSIC